MLSNLLFMITTLQTAKKSTDKYW